MVIPIINEADTVKIHSDDIPGIVAIASQVEGTSRARRNLRSSADVAEADVLGDVCRQRRPVVEARDEANSALYALVAV